MTMPNSNPTDKDEKQDKTIFFWIDILGFSDYLENDKEYKDLKRDLEEFRSLFDSSDMFKSFVISDGILIQLNDYKQIETAVEKVAKQQKEFILKTKRFLRGGIAEGYILKEEDIKNKMIITDGLAKAVKIESKNVSWPVIATDEKNLKRIRGLLNNESSYFKLRKGFNESGGNIFFVDFIETMEQSERDTYLDLLDKKIKQMSEKMKSKEEFSQPECQKIKNKYIWLLRHFYHTHGKTIYPELFEELEGFVL